MPRFPDSRSHGFTLVELLTAMAIAAFLITLLVEMLNNTSRLVTMGLSKAQQHSNARAALSFMGREMSQALLSSDTSSGPQLQFVVNPSQVSTSYLNHDSIFWQAPIATSTTAGDIAEVGYFVAWQNNQANLCRYFINPDSAQYCIYSDSNNWVTDDLLSTFSSGTALSSGTYYPGLFLENVIGLWIDAFKTGDSAAVSSNSWNSISTNSLPARVEISLIILDATTAKRITTNISTQIKSTVASSTSATSCLNNLPTIIRRGAAVVTFSVVLDNYQN